MSDERMPWDRRDGETSKAYQAFRAYRDAGPLRQLERSSATMARRWDWRARAIAWDDAEHVAEDRARLEAIRDMHRRHASVARMAITLAMEAIRELTPDNLSAGEITRLLDVAAKLERQTLTVSVEQLQGVSTGETSDPWERIARELSAT